MKSKCYILSLVVVFLSGFVFRSFAEIPPGYYDTAEGTHGKNLKTVLHEMIREADVLKYGGRGAGYTWEGFSKTDRTEDGKVLDRYSPLVWEFNGIKSVSGMNIEHSFANSWWGGINNQAYKDLHHLYPADSKANITKSNHPMGVVDGEEKFNNGVIKVGMSSVPDPESPVKVWEPSDEYKGDFARTYLYMVTCYEDYAPLWKGEGLLMLENNTYPVFQPWAVRLLLEWNREDPVSPLEEERNETVYSIQGNRNPFIDYPQLAEYIWGEQSSTAFYTDDDQVEPRLFIPANHSVVDFGLQALSVPAQKAVMIRGKNLKGDLSLTLSNELFTLSRATLSPEEVTEGTEVFVTCNPETAGTKEAVLTLAFDGKEEQVTVKGEFWDGIPAYPASDVTSSTYVKSFRASWMKIPGLPSVSLDVYTKSGETETSLSGYPCQVAASDTVVKVTQAETAYYYRVSGGGLESNEVEVFIPAVPPVFTVATTDLYFATVPGRPSPAQKVEITVMELKTYRTNILVAAPFEVSSDGVEWGNELNIEGQQQAFYIRCGSVAEAGLYEEEAVLSTPDAEDIVLNIRAEVDPAKAFFENFEPGTKTGYAAASVNCSAATWRMTGALLGTSPNDRKNDKKSVRIKGGGTVEMETVKNGGVGTLSFYAGLYGTDTGVKFSVYYQADDSEEWTPVATDVDLAKDVWQSYAYTLNVKGDIRLKIEAAGSATKRMNLDDVSMSDYDGSVGVNDLQLSACKVWTRPGKLFVASDAVLPFSLYTLQGVRIEQAEMQPGENVFSLASGMYILKLESRSIVICL